MPNSSTRPAQHQPWITLALLLLCIGLTLMGILPRVSQRQRTITVEEPDIRVAVQGAVAREGVYSLPWGSTVEDLVQVAGGFAGGAERSLINLAAPLDEGSSIFVPYARQASGSRRISLNSASQAELEQLPGVGPSTAQKIIAGRPYLRLEDLLQVSGIGEVTLERLRPLVRL